MGGDMFKVAQSYIIPFQFVKSVKMMWLVSVWEEWWDPDNENIKDRCPFGPFCIN